MCRDPHERDGDGGPILQRAEAEVLHHPDQLPRADQPLPLHAQRENQVSINRFYIILFLLNKKTKKVLTGFI